MNKNILVFPLLLLVGAVLGFWIDRAGGGNKELTQEVQKLQTQIEQARKILPETPAEMQSVGGTITSISGNAFTLTISPLNPFDDFITTRTVATNANTKIVLLKQKDPEIYREEVAAYQALIRGGKYAEEGSPSSPDSFAETAGTFSDIQQGRFASVQADHNIKDEQNFTATEVHVQVSSDTPVAE